MPNSRDEREQEVRTKYSFVVTGGEYHLGHALFAVADGILTGGNFTYDFLQNEVAQFGIDLALALANAGINPLNEPLYFDKFIFENWEQPLPGVKVPLPNKFVPYVAAKRNNLPEPPSNPQVIIQTRRLYSLNCFDSVGKVSAVDHAHPDPGISDEIFTFSKYDGSVGPIGHGDRIVIKTRRGYYFNSYDSAGPVSGVPGFSADPNASDEIFTIARVNGQPGALRSGDAVYFITRRGYYLNAFDSIGDVKAINGYSDNPAISDEIFRLQFVS